LNNTLFYKAAAAVGIIRIMLMPCQAAAEGINPIHPAFTPLDALGQKVSNTGKTASPDTTCGQCHDTKYILRHNSHANNKSGATCFDCHSLELKKDLISNGALDSSGMLKREFIRIHPPGNENCGGCHGVVQEGQTPLALPDDFNSTTVKNKYSITRYTGAIFSPQDISISLLNLAGKDSLHKPWDIHARRGVGCTGCHYSPNNPARAVETNKGVPHLKVDPRRKVMDEFLLRPNHELTAASCATCHDPLKGHDFLSFKKLHMEVLACQSCHTPRLYGPALMMVDETVPNSQGMPLSSFRGVLEDWKIGIVTNNTFTKGYQPVLLPSKSGGKNRVAPFNLVTDYRWVSGRGGAIVPFETVIKAAKMNRLEGTGPLSPTSIDLMKKTLSGLGVIEPEISGIITAHEIEHGISGREGARRECTDCHNAEKEEPIKTILSDYTPGGILPVSKPSSEVQSDKEEFMCSLKPSIGKDGTIKATCESQNPRIHLFGYTHENISDRLGLGFLLLVVLGVAAHASMRLMFRSRRATNSADAVCVYMFSSYERMWHWLMTFSVIILMATGLEIHFSGIHRLIPLSIAVSIHNVFAAILTVNAFLALFYYVVSNAIRQFIPKRNTVIDGILTQIRFYTWGMFLGMPHPTRDAGDRKLNPLQQITYLALLNVLFPIQVITGTIMAAVSYWPGIASMNGWLGMVAPLHNFGSWLFISFFALHVYLITTGHRLTSSLKGMVTGYEEIEKRCNK